jgi:alanine racemase
LLFSQPHSEEIPKIINSGLIPFISDENFASELNKKAEERDMTLPVHLKIDTGMGRLGCSIEEALPLARYINSSLGLELTGIATHFSVADSAEEQNIVYTQEQLARFKAVVEQIRADGIDPGIVHAANSGGVILHPDSWLDMVRPGLFLYGYKTVEENETPPAHRQKLSVFEPLRAEPVLELRSNISLIKKIKKGESVSYGRTWTAPQDTFIAVIPLGYANGFPRLASNKWQVNIGRNTYPLIGRITMDQCCIDLGPEPNVRRWEEVVVLGGTNQDAAVLADITETIPYEITCYIGKMSPRLYQGYGIPLSDSHFHYL